MPARDSPAILVARFLRSNNYNATLEAFLSEAGLSPDAGTVEKGDLTIEKILQEKKIFDLSLTVEKFGVSDIEWSLPVPTYPVEVKTLPSAANLLHVSMEKTTHDPSAGAVQLLFATTADRRLNFLVPTPTFPLFRSRNFIHDSPILSCVTLGIRHLTTISTSMSGQVVVYDHKEDLVIDERRDHTKYVVKVTAWEDGRGTWVATAGWDAKIFIYRLGSSTRRLGPPVLSIPLATNPETVMFMKHPDTKSSILLFTRRDSTSLHFFTVPSLDESADAATLAAGFRALGSQNLAPRSNAWIAFSPSSISLCPTDPTLLAVATSSIPHMKLIVVRLLIPSMAAPSRSSTASLTQAAQTTETLARQDREDSAILINVSTLAPQTAYSTPQVRWRPDGCGVWVNGDDGVLRGLEARTGKIVATLKGGHDAGSKIRSVWAGMVSVDGEEQEWVVSGGFDKKLIVWKPEKDD